MAGPGFKASLFHWCGLDKAPQCPFVPAHASYTTCVTWCLGTFWRSPQPWTPTSQLSLLFLVIAVLSNGARSPGRVWEIVLTWHVCRQAPHLESVLVPTAFLLTIYNVIRYEWKWRDIKAKQMTERAVSTFKCCFSRSSPNPSVWPSISNSGRNCPWEAIPTVECYHPKTKMNDQQRISVGDFLHPCAVSFIKQYE